MPMPNRFTKALGRFAMGGERLPMMKKVQNLFKDLGSPLGWLPKPLAIAERSTGKTMGWHADKMAELNQIARPDQDEFALASHKKAFAAQKAGRLAEEIAPLKTKRGEVLDEDNLIRGDSELSKMAKLRPVFRKKPFGSITAATSSALTDGASAVLVMSEAKAKELGYPTDIVMKAFVTEAIEPMPQLLLAPAIAIPKALDQAGLTMDDIDIVEMHEAFAAQCLSTFKVLEDPVFCKNVLGLDKPLPKVPEEKINPNGSSIAIGHPFAATGGRIVTSAANELRRTGKKYAMISVCAAGGLGGVAILERV
eukprot:TRINITY_DN3877_c0_g1_i5.p1 TRINITY_DN3877_c0_g1~~TRINITY_DN3877_c0_g1_i5.p1  ORF type:complete len:309 (-),score=125.48 TRINITY_DN3877_c0_g1_i5:738-1664(-)